MAWTGSCNRCGLCGCCAGPEGNNENAPGLGLHYFDWGRHQNRLDDHVYVTQFIFVAAGALVNEV